VRAVRAETALASVRVTGASAAAPGRWPGEPRPAGGDRGQPSWRLALHPPTSCRPATAGTPPTSVFFRPLGHLERRVSPFRWRRSPSAPWPTRNRGDDLGVALEGGPVQGRRGRTRRHAADRRSGSASTIWRTPGEVPGPHRANRSVPPAPGRQAELRVSSSTTALQSPAAAPPRGESRCPCCARRRSGPETNRTPRPRRSP